MSTTLDGEGTRTDGGLGSKEKTGGIPAPSLTGLKGPTQPAPVPTHENPRDKQKGAAARNCYIEIDIHERAPPSKPKGRHQEQEKAGATQHIRIEFELFDDKLPKTCENFRKMCGEHVYEQFIFDDISYDYMQSGAIDLDAAPNDALAPIGDMSEVGESHNDHDDRLQSHGDPGLLSTHRSTSKFIITSEAATWLNQDYAVFGKVVIGIKDAQKLMKNYGTLSSRPKADAIITKCGLVSELSSATVTGPENDPGVEAQQAKPDNPNDTRENQVPPESDKQSSTADTGNVSSADCPRDENAKISAIVEINSGGGTEAHLPTPKSPASQTESHEQVPPTQSSSGVRPAQDSKKEWNSRLSPMRAFFKRKILGGKKAAVSFSTDETAEQPAANLKGSGGN